jgi:hypothetical protein
MEESISRESGADFGENTPAEEFRRLIRELGRVPVERTTLYGVVQRFEDPALDPPSREPQKTVELSGPARWRKTLEDAAGSVPAASASASAGRPVAVARA